MKPGPWTPSKGHNKPLSALDRSRITQGGDPTPGNHLGGPAVWLQTSHPAHLAPSSLGRAPLAGLSTHSGERKVPGEKEAREEDDGSGEGCPLEYLLKAPGPRKGRAGRWKETVGPELPHEGRGLGWACWGSYSPSLDARSLSRGGAKAPRLPPASFAL